MSNFSTLFGEPNPNPVIPQMFCLESSRVVTFTRKGTLLLGLIGAGGSGARASLTRRPTTGGNSGPVAFLTLAVEPGTQVNVTLGAGGAPPANNLPGTDGGASTVRRGSTLVLTVPGGAGGVYSATIGASVSSGIPLPPTGADFFYAGLRAGAATDGASTGGAAPDLFGTGLGVSPPVVGDASTVRYYSTGGAVGRDGRYVGTDTGLTQPTGSPSLHPFFRGLAIAGDSTAGSGGGRFGYGSNANPPSPNPLVPGGGAYCEMYFYPEE